MIDCPCIDCICKPACRYKAYTQLTIDCTLAKDFILGTYGSINSPLYRDDVRLGKLYEVLDPIYWELQEMEIGSETFMSIRWTAKGILKYESKKGGTDG